MPGLGQAEARSLEQHPGLPGTQVLGHHPLSPRGAPWQEVGSEGEQGQGLKPKELQNGMQQLSPLCQKGSACKCLRGGVQGFPGEEGGWALHAGAGQARMDRCRAGRTQSAPCFGIRGAWAPGQGRASLCPGQWEEVATSRGSAGPGYPAEREGWVSHHWGGPTGGRVQLELVGVGRVWPMVVAGKV